MTFKLHTELARTWKLAAAVVAVAAVTHAVALPPPLPPLPKGNRAQQPISNAKMQILDDIINVGHIMDHTPVAAGFKFRSIGKDPLEILSVKPDCGCTLAAIVKLVKSESGEITEVPFAEGIPMIFNSGEEGLIRITYDPAGKRGQQGRKVRIASNDASSGVTTVHFRATVHQQVMVTPSNWMAGSIDKGQGKEVILTVTGRTEDFEATRITFDNMDLFEVEKIGTEPIEIEGEEGPLRRTSFKIRVKNDVPVGPLRAEGFIRTNDPSRKLVKFTVTGGVRGDLNILPQRLAFGVLKVGDKLDRQLKVISRSGTPFNITDIPLPVGQDLITGVTFEPVDPANPIEWIVKFTGEAVKAAPRINGIFEISTDVDQESVLKLPFIANVRAR